METTLSFSSLKAFARSPEHFIAYKNRKLKTTSAMEFGSAVHVAVLEPEKFHEEYDLALGRKNTIVYKEQLKKGKKLLTQSDWDSCHRIQEKVLTHPMSAELLSQCKSFEKEVTGRIHGYNFRGFVDATSDNFLIDLKTTKDGSPREFTRAVWKHKYHLQGAIYTELTGAKDYWIISVENTYPFVVTAYLMTEDLLNEGRHELEHLCNLFGEWDGMSGGYDVDSDYGFFHLDKPEWVL